MSQSHFKGASPAQGSRHGARFVQELRPMRRGICLLLPLPRVIRCRPTWAKPTTAALVGHTALPVSNYQPFLEGEIPFNPKADPTKNTKQVTESELEPCSSPGSGEESPPRRNTQSRTGRGLPALRFSFRQAASRTSEAAVPELTGQTAGTISQQNRKTSAAFALPKARMRCASETE